MHETASGAIKEQMGAQTENLDFSFLVDYVEERPWWPIQSPNKGRERKVKG